MSGKMISCGIILLSHGDVLMGHVTNQSFWDIPKGGMEGGEDFAETAIRETFEETGLVLERDELTELGLFSYNNYKDLFLFACDITPLNKTEEDLSCKSTMNMLVDGVSEVVPEMDAFRFFSWYDAINKSPKSLSSLLKRLPSESVLSSFYIRF